MAEFGAGFASMAHHDPAQDWRVMCAPAPPFYVPGSSTRDKHRIHQKKFIISRYISKKKKVEKFTKNMSLADYKSIIFPSSENN